MKRGFAPDCDPDKVMPATEIGLQAMLAAENQVAAFAEYRASRRLGLPPSLEPEEKRDIARLVHAGVFNGGGGRWDYKRDIAQMYLGEDYEAVLELDHDDLLGEHSCATAEDNTPHEAIRARIERLSDETGIDEFDLRQFHRRIGIHPYGAEHWMHDDDRAEEIRTVLEEAYPCELYSPGAVHGDFAVVIESGKE